MARKTGGKKGLIEQVEGFALQLLYSASGGTQGVKPRRTSDPTLPAVELKEQKAIFDSLMKLVAVKHKVDPEEEDVSGLADIKKRMEE